MAVSASEWILKTHWPTEHTEHTEFTKEATMPAGRAGPLGRQGSGPGCRRLAKPVKTVLIRRAGTSTFRATSDA